MGGGLSSNLCGALEIVRAVVLHALARGGVRVFADLVVVARAADDVVGTAAALSSAETHAAAQARGRNGAALAGVALFHGSAVLVPTQGYGSGHNRCYGCYGWLLITPHNTS